MKTISISRLCDTCGRAWLNPGESITDLVESNSIKLAHLRPYGVEVVVDDFGNETLVANVQLPGTIEVIEVSLGDEFGGPTGSYASHSVGGFPNY